MSGYGPKRAVDYNYYLFLFFVFATMLYWFGWMRRRAKVRDESVSRQKARQNARQGKQSGQKEMQGTILAIVASTCFVLYYAVTTYADPNAATSVSAARSLLNGEARQYKEQYEARLSVYSSGEKNPEVAPLESKPNLIYLGDLSTDPGDYRNSAEAQWHGLDSITLSGQ
jgi:hypothetical protein